MTISSLQANKIPTCLLAANTVQSHRHMLEARRSHSQKNVIRKTDFLEPSTEDGFVMGVNGWSAISHELVVFKFREADKNMLNKSTTLVSSLIHRTHTHEVETTCNYSCYRNISSSHCPIISPARLTLAHLQQPKIRLSEICCQGVMSATSTCPELRPKTTTSLAPCLQTDPLVIQVQIQPKRKPQMNWTLNYQGS